MVERVGRLRRAAMIVADLRKRLDRLRQLIASGNRGAVVHALQRKARKRADELNTALADLRRTSDENAIKRAGIELLREMTVIERELARTPLH